MKNTTVAYYINLLRRDGTSRGHFIKGAFLNLEASTNEELVRDIPVEALRGMGAFKYPNPDGYQAIFLKRIWNLIGAAVHNFVKKTVDVGEILVEAAEALLVLIPKESHLSTIKNFCPINLCNVVVKLVFKYL